QVQVDGLRKQLLAGQGPPPLAALLGDRMGLWRALALGSLAIELGAPVVLGSRRLSRLWAAAAFAMHWGILGVMKIKFRYQLSGVTFAPFFPLERFARLFERRS
ncbi:MAG: hypothetical protein ACRDZO_17965, partial [Egibacteraceae bacterium]